MSICRIFAMSTWRRKKRRRRINDDTSGRWSSPVSSHSRILLALFTVFVLFETIGASSDVGLDLAKCDGVLGMQNGDIDDSALSASSSADVGRRGPTSSRIRTEKGDGAWCPKVPISSESYEYLEIDLRQMKVVTMVETQGRFGNGQGTEHTDQYRLEYQRENGGVWFRFKNRRGQEVFVGNSNTYIAEMREVQPVIIALRVRFIPISSHPRNVCLRVELYGCPWTDGVVAYEMPQGDRYGLDVNLIDMTYDGTPGMVLTGGLGQLTDGEEGQANFQLDGQDVDTKDNKWIGWQNMSFIDRPLSISFKFDSARNFSVVYIRCNNMFSKGVRVFRLALVYFAVEKDGFDKSPGVRYSYARDDQAEYARTIKIPLENRIGSFVKLELFFDDSWIMISEIRFDSVYASPDGMLADEKRNGKIGLNIQDRLTSSDDMTIISGLSQTKDEGSTKKSSEYRRQNTSLSPQINDVIDANEWTVERPKPDDKSVTWMSTPSGGLWNQSDFRSGLDYGSVVVMIIVLAVLLLVLFFVLLIIFYQRHRLVCMTGSCGPNKSSAILTNPPSSCSISRPSSLLYPSSYLIHSTSYRPCNPVPSYSHHDDPCHSTATDLLISSPTLVSPYATIDLPLDQTVEMRSEESSLDGVYSTPAAGLQLLLPSIPSMVDIPRSCLKFVRTLGEGSFGQVYVCEVLEPSASCRNLGSSLVLHESSRPPAGSLVAVKVLQHNCGELKRSMFDREVRKMLKMKDPNIGAMLTFYLDEEPFCIILEYPRFGDLKSFLRKRGAEQFNHEPKIPAQDLLSYGCLIFMASQVASGMKFFETNRLVHRDLAARNCLVGDDFTVKVADLGTGHIQFAQDYSTAIGQVLLPLRWMAWESVLLGSFTTKSDVWSFAVTVWEILTMAEAPPYDGLTDDEVIENCHNIYCENGGEVLRLDKPDRCPREIYDLLCNCWSKDDTQRPTFHEIHMFLQNKNTGYHPANEKLSTYGGTQEQRGSRPHFV